MSSITIKAGLDSGAFRSGLQAMQSEARNFRDAFRKNIEQGGGLFGSFDAALGKLATGRFAGPIAAIGAGMIAIRAVADGLDKHWQNIAAATDRARQNVEAIEATRAAVSGQRYTGENANEALERDIAAKRAALATAQSEANQVGDPTTMEGRAAFARGMNKNSLAGYFDFLRLTASQYIPGMGKPSDEASAEYNRRQDALQKALQEVTAAEELSPYEQYANRSAQRSAQSAQITAEDKLGMAQGRTTGYEAAANKLLTANAQYQDTLKTFGENDPRTIQAKASALDAFTAYDSELTNARKFRNDPTIAADSLARLGGGGSVNVFGNGQGELLFEQKRLNQSISGLTQVMQTLNVTLSRTNMGGDVSQ